ncbi:MAG: hypothetical protein LC136_07730 [Burkholderiales bacterium]|nr:hypothetical protein [Burkholderiales bacterium]
MSTRDLGERLLTLADEVEDWTTADHPEAAAIIQELFRRDTALAREALEAAGVTSTAARKAIDADD